MASKKSKINNLLPFVVLGLMLVVAVSVLLQPKSIVKNKEVIGELNRLSSALLTRDLTSSDFDQLRQLVSGDKTAEESLAEIDWLFANGETEHVSHTISFLYTYATTGDKVPCIPHELAHMSLLIQHNDLELAADHTEEIRANFEPWIAKSEKARKILPAYYKNFEELKSRISDVITRLEVGDYSQATLEEIEFVEKNSVC